MFRKKAYIVVTINDDNTGRVHYVTSPPTNKEKILHGIFLNHMGDGHYKNVAPGRYHFKLAKLGFRFHYDLIPID